MNFETGIEVSAFGKLNAITRRVIVLMHNAVISSPILTNIFFRGEIVEKKEGIICFSPNQSWGENGFLPSLDLVKIDEPLIEFRNEFSFK